MAGYDLSNIARSNSIGLRSIGQSSRFCAGKRFANALAKPCHYNVLKVVARMGRAGMPSQSIAQYMVARDPDITRLVDRLQKDRSIERERDEQDRRIVRVRVTQSGLDAIEKLDPLIWKLHQQQLGHLNPEKLELLNQLLVAARLKP